MSLNSLAAILPPFVEDLRPFLLALVVASLSAFPVYKLLLALKSRQNVSQYAPEGHQKKQGTPTMGGIIVAIGFLAVPFYGAIRGNHRYYEQNSAIFWLFLSFALIGFVDDFVVPRVFPGKRGLGWKQKIIMQFAAAVFCAHTMYGDFSLECWGMVFFILFFSNAYNFSDGLDALASLLLVGLVFGLVFLTYFEGQWGLSRYLVALLGAIIPFLYLNKPKAKIFMGDVGSLPIGAVLGMVVAVLVYPRSGPGLTFDTLLIRTDMGAYPMTTPLSSPQGWMLRGIILVIVSGMMIVELVPVPLQILSVKVRKKKLFSFTPVHHAFEKKGWPEIKVVAIFAGCQLLMSLVAVALAMYACRQFIHVTATAESQINPFMRRENP
jgi:phospho-N-acetylmuramoyl-pentapeptide-transferase